MKVGLVGAGTMGSRMCLNLIRAGHDVFVRDISDAAARVAAQMGAIAVDSPKAVASFSEVVLLSLPMPADVDTVVRGGDGLLAGAREGLVIADLSTVDPACTQRNAAVAERLGVGYLDSPVLGRPPGCGGWTLPVGGEAAALERAKPALEALAKTILHVGPSGHGNIIKLLNNMMFGAINAVGAEILSACEKVGMDPQMLYSAVAGSGAATVSNLFREAGQKMLARDFSPLFKLDLLFKDMDLGIRMAEQHGAHLYISPAAQRLNGIAREKGYGGEDTCAVLKIYEELNGKGQQGGYHE